MTRSVTLVLPGYQPAVRYGGFAALHSLALALVRTGSWKVSVLTTDADGPERLRIPEVVIDQGVEVRYLRRVAREAAVPQLPYVLARLKPRPDLVHVAPPFSSTTWLAGATALAGRTPVILSPRGSFQPWALGHKAWKKRAGLSVLRHLFNQFSAAHATSTEEEEAIRSILPRIPLRTIPNGTEMDPSPSGIPEAGPPVIVFLGRIHPIKALDRLIGAAKILRDQGRDFRLVVAGPAEDGHDLVLRNLANRLGLAANIDWLGMVAGDEKWRVLRAARVVVLPSHSENFGNVVVEALSCGRPAIASRGTPWRALEQHGCGLWVDNSERALAAAIETYLTSAPRAAEDGQRGRAWVQSEFSWDSVANRMSDFYDEIIQSHVRTASGLRDST